MRTLAIGDIHGCFRSLDRLTEFVGFNVDDRIVTLGDCVDRGPDTRKVIEWLLTAQRSGNLVPLRGNHELMMIAARASVPHARQWMACGGDAVLDSYGIERLDQLPKEHWQFFTKMLRPYFETETHFFVHANAYADLDLANQPDFMLYWEHFSDTAPHQSGRTMICGHTPQPDGFPRTLGHAVCIDTGACKGGWLTCLDVDAGYCWQANEAGQTRQFWLDDCQAETRP